jgi:hypothetical protein
MLMVSVDCHFLNNLDSVVAVEEQSPQFVPHDTTLERVPNVVQHGPYLPYLPPLVQQLTVFSTCFVDFETKFSLAFRSNEAMQLNQLVQMNSGTYCEK